MKKIFIIVGIVLAVLGGCAALVIGASGSSSDTTTAVPADTPVNRTDKIADGKFKFEILSTSTGKTNVGGEYGSNAQGVFTVMKIKVTNIGDQSQIFSSDDQYGYDVSGAKYSVDGMATFDANSETNLWLSEINPGNSVTGNIVFDIPKGKKLTKIELHDSAFSGGVTVNLP